MHRRSFPFGKSVRSRVATRARAHRRIAAVAVLAILQSASSSSPKFIEPKFLFFFSLFVHPQQVSTFIALSEEIYHLRIARYHSLGLLQHGAFDTHHRHRAKCRPKGLKSNASRVSSHSQTRPAFQDYLRRIFLATDGDLGCEGEDALPSHFQSDSVLKPFRVTGGWTCGTSVASSPTLHCKSNF